VVVVGATVVVVVVVVAGAGVEFGNTILLTDSPELYTPLDTSGLCLLNSGLLDIFIFSALLCYKLYINNFLLLSLLKYRMVVMDQLDLVVLKLFYFHFDQVNNHR
jgi:hypothetical protein